MWRAYIAQHKYRVVLDGIGPAGDATPPALTAIRRLAEYMAQPEKRAAIVEWFDEQQLLTDADMEERSVWCCAAATVYYNEALYETALK